MESKKKPRDGWEESFRKIAENGDDQLLIPDIFEDEKIEEWKPDK